ncbi:MAG: CHAT domain-containing protein [Ktedonobacteraceae bacterium]|nr:CHAT domain-containing protein [Ktedonobacteraceae bacterium]
MNTVNYVNIDISVQRDLTEEHSYLVIASTTGKRKKVEAGRFSFFPQTWRDIEPSLRALKVRDAAAHVHVLKVRDFGKHLFNCLLKENVRRLYDEKKQDAARNSKILRLRLMLAPLELVVLPWELLYDERASEYLCLEQQPRTVLVRSIEHMKPARHGRSQDPSPLKIIGMVADPRDLPSVGGKERDDIEQALQPLIENNQVTLSWKQGKYTELSDLRLGTDRVDIFHFIGHGRFDEDHQQGYLEFEDDRKSSRSVSAEHLRRSLHATTKLVVLNACETARGDQFNRFSNIAHGLASVGIPGVIAMQFKIGDIAAHQFAKVFYTLLARGTPVDEALAEARYSIAGERDSLDWAAPLLYVSAANILKPIIDPSKPESLPSVSPNQNQSPPQPEPKPLVKLVRLIKGFLQSVAIGWKKFPLWKKAVTVAVLLVLIIAGIITGTTYKKLGGLDLTTYCHSLHYQEAVETAGGWYCSGSPSLKIDMTRACNWQYSRNDLTAEAGDLKNPSSWLCYDSQKQEVGGIKDMAGFCTSQGYEQAALAGAKTADDWYCERQPRQSVDLTRVCTQQYHRIDAQARKNDGGLWECYGLSILG